MVHGSWFMVHNHTNPVYELSFRDVVIPSRTAICYLSGYLGFLRSMDPRVPFWGGDPPQTNPPLSPVVIVVSLCTSPYLCFFPSYPFRYLTYLIIMAPSHPPGSVSSGAKTTYIIIRSQSLLLFTFCFNLIALLFS